MRVWEWLRLGGVLVAAALLGLPVGRPADAHDDGGMFKKMDSNGDGKISAEEHAAGAKKMFEMMDANKDGKVNATEMTAAHDKIAGGKGEREEKAGIEKGKEISAAEKIKVVDTNADGVVTAEEHAAGSRSMFEKMDANHDGFLSKAEMMAGHAKLMQKPASAPTK
jgi:Ca2+-binding EF-hand superfamily protein